MALSAQPHSHLECVSDEASDGVELAKFSSPSGLIRSDASAAIETYRAVARRLVPRWIWVLDQDDSLAGDGGLVRATPASPRQLWRRLLAGLAVALVCEFDPDYRHGNDARRRVATTLIHWQLSLAGNGRPRRRRDRNDPLQIANSATVIRLLSDTPGFQNESLLADVDRHLAWLARQQPPTAWLEAAAIGAFVDGALLVREPYLLELARERLASLLGRQDAEGWFAAPTNDEMAQLPRIVEWLARVYEQQRWEELREPLQRALRALSWFERLDGRIACGIGCDRMRVIPFSAETLAPHLPEAIPLMMAARRYCRAWSQGIGGFPTPDPESGVSMAAAAAEASGVAIREDSAADSSVPAQAHMPSAGVVVHRTRAYRAWVSVRGGGAFSLEFSGVAPPIHDVGVMVHHGHGTYAAEPRSRRTRYGVTAQSISIGGTLVPVAGSTHAAQRLRRWIMRRVRGLGGRGLWPSRQRKHSRRPFMTGSNEDRFRREITFCADSVRIRDVVICHTPCEALACQVSNWSSPDAIANFDPPHDGIHSPILVDGGRKVEIIRVYREGRLVEQLPSVS